MSFLSLISEFFINNPKLIPLLLFTALLLITFRFFKQPNSKVFLLDIACYKPPDSQLFSRKLYVDRARQYAKFKEETLIFMEKMLKRSGIGDNTYGAEALLMEPPEPDMEHARKEAEMVMFGAIDELLAKTKVQTKDIGILIVNCGVFNVEPCLSAMVVHRYKLRDDIKTYNITGMGCSAGLRVLGLAKYLLQVHPETYALVMSTENITTNFYVGNDPSMLLTNCLFRVGGAAILLSNRKSDRPVAKYQLIHAVHTNTASSDRSYNCIFRERDDEGNEGITINKDLLYAAVKTIKTNVTLLAPLILPVSEQFRYARNYLLRRVLGAKIKPYHPDFTKAVDHFFSHVGGKPVLDELQKTFGFSDEQMEASRMTLYKFGNTSSSSVWYELAYTEAKGRIKKGDTLWQIQFGSGFKCSSVIWRAIRNVDKETVFNAWTDEIDNYPVDVSNIGKMPFEFAPSK